MTNHNNKRWAPWDLSPTDARYEYQLMHEGKFTEIHHIESTRYLLTTPPKTASDKLAEITDLCLQREIPTDRIRLVWWELGGSDAGWYFDWQGWRGKSYKQEKSKRDQRLRDPYRYEAREIAHIREIALPEAPSAWVHLTPDEANSAGYGDRIDHSLDFDAQPRTIRVELWKEELYPTHKLEFRMAPRQPGFQYSALTAFAEFVCTRCHGKAGWVREEGYQLVLEALQGTRAGSEEEQVRLTEFFLRGRDRSFSGGELNRNRDRVRGILAQPLRGEHPLACKK